MKTDLDHLPDRQRRDIARIVEILRADFEAHLTGKTMPYKRNGKILKVILYGSYARGNWVDDPVSGYVSDYDILVVVNHEKLTEIEKYWYLAEDRLIRDYIRKRIAAPLGLIVHSLDDVNAQLERGRYFFMDILKEGIVHHEAPEATFATPQPLSPDVAYEEAKGYFENWTQGANNFLELAETAISKRFDNEAAFLLHQVSERLCHCMLLTFTLYSPKSHNLNLLRPRAEALDRRIVDACPRATRPERGPFNLVQRAYIEARYSPHYVITPEELATATEQVAKLRDLVRAACEQRLDEEKEKIRVRG